MPGVPLALGSAALFGATPVLSKLLLAAMDPALLAGVLYLGAGGGLALYKAASQRRGGAAEASLGRSDLVWVALATALGGVAGPLLLMSGLALTAASGASLLLNLESLATMAIAWLVYRESVDRRLLIGALAILAGAVLLSWQGQGVGLDTRSLLVAGACLCWGLDNNFTRKVSGSDPVTIAMLKGLVAGAVNTGIALVAGAALPSVAPAAGAAALGFFGIGVSLVFFIMALRHLGTARTGAYYALAPFIGATLAVIVLDEPLTVRFLSAGALMAFGLWLHLTENHVHEHVHEALEHEHAHVHDEHHRHAHDGEVAEPHSHWHRHEPMRHKHPHFPDLHHRHDH